MEEIGEAILTEIQKPVVDSEGTAAHNVAVGRLLALHQIAHIPDIASRNAETDLEEIAKYTPKLMENEDVEIRPSSSAP
jgi:hypothetical protein